MLLLNSCLNSARACLASSSFCFSLSITQCIYLVYCKAVLQQIRCNYAGAACSWRRRLKSALKAVHGLPGLHALVATKLPRQALWRHRHQRLVAIVLEALPAAARFAPQMSRQARKQPPVKSMALKLMAAFR